MPWLKTVVKHEALAVRRQRERAAPVTDDGELSEPPAPARPKTRLSATSAFATAPRHCGD